MKGAAGETAAEFEKRVQSLAGGRGFTLFKEIDHGDWLPVYRIRRPPDLWQQLRVADALMRHEWISQDDCLLIRHRFGRGSSVLSPHNARVATLSLSRKLGLLCFLIFILILDAHETGAQRAICSGALSHMSRSYRTRRRTIW